LRYVILSGELQGPGVALERLSTMRRTDWEQRPPTEHERNLTELLEKVYRQQRRHFLVGCLGGGGATAGAAGIGAENAEDGPSDALTDAERTELRKQFDWFGDLALAPEGQSDPESRTALLAQAWRIVIVSLVVVLTFLMLAGVGFLLLLTIPLLLLIGFLRFRFQSGSRDGGVYAETFALWMVVYLVLERAASYVPLGSWRMLAAGVVGLLTLGTLAWPLLRGVQWRRVRQDIGWWTPGPRALEMIWGIGGYLAAMPLTVVGVLMSAGLLRLYYRLAGEDPFGIPPQSTHPVKEMLERGNAWDILQILFVAAVCAPIIEETMFRGVLYRHLREIGTKWPRLVSVLFSVFASSFVFAVIHPQGFLGVPVLMALAIGFALTREMRGSLLGSITAHGINNALVTLVAVSMS
jgi:membrane protease YdiL (CAAX protease family)